MNDTKHKPPRRDVSIVLLLHEAERSLSVVERVKQVMQQLNIQPTTDSMVSISGRISEQQFAKLFDQQTRAMPEIQPTEMDAGRPAGYAADELTVPQALMPWVQSISVIPPATRFAARSLDEL